MRILLVDDEEAGRELLADFLEDQLGHQVVQCENAESALEEYKKNPVPLVVTDIKMPGMSGVDLLKAIRGMNCTDKADVILITAFDEIETIAEAFNNGAFEYLLKPIKLREFEEIINRVEQYRKDQSDVVQENSRQISEGESTR